MVIGDQMWRVLTFVGFEEGVRQGKGDEGGNGEDKVRKELSLVHSWHVFLYRKADSVTCSS